MSYCHFLIKSKYATMMHTVTQSVLSQLFTLECIILPIWNKTSNKAVLAFKVNKLLNINFESTGGGWNQLLYEYQRKRQNEFAQRRERLLEEFDIAEKWWSQDSSPGSNYFSNAC